MATMSALQKRIEELRKGNVTRSNAENYLAGNPIYNAGSNAPNASGDNQYTPDFDAEYALRESDIARRRQIGRSGATSALERLYQAARSNRTGLNKLHGEALRSNRAAMADQGLFRSGININQVGEIGQDFLEALMESERDVGNQAEDVERDLALGESDLNFELQAAQFDRAQNEYLAQLERAKREAELVANQEALAATQREIELLKDEIKAKRTATGKFTPPGVTKKPKKKPGAKPKQKAKPKPKPKKKLTPAQLRARRRRRLNKKKKKK